MRIHDAHDFDARRSCKELLSAGFTAVDDVSGTLINRLEEELFDELGFAGDDLDIKTDRIETAWGPVFVFRDTSRVTLEQMKKLVATDRPLA